ncbi:hypothetical protein [Rhodothermus marinus]|uniref:Uncharacterized protein n=1 Tax=Rhodothermus marinus (strain ATCC 43812 / DSM 4252 / R-10) TaxID=518766 RepID=D0MJZ9_RHOM4|nr:hypothetical protein [Rhodothermus marinus]ACY46912.1 hypothetical protein Rmar_0003 [Rhodothermus marinus DSM 4252]
MKETLGDKILRYPWLSRETQREIEQEALRDPAWRELLEAVQSIMPLLQSLPLTPEGPMSEEMLAFYLVTRRLSDRPLPPSLAALFARLEAQLEADPTLRSRCEEMARQLDELVRKFDAPAHFERLTGRSLERETEPALIVAEESASFAAPEGGRAVVDAPNRLTQRPELAGAPDRPAQRLARRSAWRWVERGAFVVVVLSVIYGGLFWWSRASQSELERLGFIAPAQLEVEQYRGEAAPGASEAERTYQEALREIRAAHRSFLGLFPHYDAERLARAESLLVAVVTAAPESSLLRQEAQWLLGKVRLLRHDVDGARQVLQEVAAREGPYTEAARQLLTQLRCLETPELC